MNRILSICAVSLFAVARFAHAEDGKDGGEKRPEPRVGDDKREGKDGDDEKEARARAERKAAEARKWQEERKKCELGGHHRCSDNGKKACHDEECSKHGHKKCREEAIKKCKRACEEIRAKGKKEKGGDLAGKDGDKDKLGMKPGDIVPGGKPDGDAKIGKGDEKGGDGGDKKPEGKKGGDEKPGDDEKGSDEGGDEDGDDGMGDLK